jgi:hypothetical protein
MDAVRGDAVGAVRTGRAWRIRILVGTGVLAVAIAFATDRVGQDQTYFDFAGSRAVLVLSNAAFAWAGVAGLLGLLRGRFAFRDARERWPWAVLFAGVALTSVGSAWFHLAPNDDSLAWDRLPMAVGFMGLLAALVAERIDPAAGVRLLAPLVLAGMASVAYWIVTEHAGDGDLRPYLLVQLYPLACILLVLVLFPPAYTGSGAWVVALAAYGIAKWAELADARVHDALLGVVSGHTAKHLLAAGGVAVLVRMLRRRRVLAPPGALRA